MADRDPFDLVEMSPGAQPPSGFGDRILVGLALIAIVAGAMVAVANLLPDRTDVAEASVAPSEDAPRTPRPSPTPRLPRVATLQDPDVGLVPPPEQPYAFDGWIRASVDLVIRSSPNLEAGEIGVLKQGEIAYASQQDQGAGEPGWLSVQVDRLQDSEGWVATIADGEQLARRYESPQVQGSGWIESVTAGPEGFVTMFTPPGGPYVYGPQRPAVSTDGARWQPANASVFDGWWIGSAAWGPSGWLAAAGVFEGSQPRILIWSSPDGLSWSRLGELGGLNGDGLRQLIGSENGYLLETEPQSGGFGASSTLWSSGDGLIWTESTDGIEIKGGADDRRIAAVAGGFYMWDNGLGFVTPGSVAAFSVDGSTWSGVGHDAPNGVNLRLASIQDRVVAIDHDRTTLDPRVWSGSVADGRMVWERLEGSDEAFAGGVVTQVVSDGRRSFAFGWDLSTEQPLVWTGNGVEWVRERLPETFGGLPRAAAAGPRGVVVVGYRHTFRGDNPIVWHRTAGGDWLPEPDPMLALVRDPTTDDCAPLPTDLLEFNVIDSAAVIFCYGDAPITFQAFSVRCEGCSWFDEGNPQPAWLLNPGGNQIYLSPTESNDGSWWNAVTLGPGVTRDAAWTDKWIEVTGHFDDPAAATCRRDVAADSVSDWTGLQAVVDQCRQVFVVTEVTVLSPH